MELKELILIFKKNVLFYIGIVLFCVLVAIVWQRNEKDTFQATLLLNIGRSGSEQVTTEYTYDSFYRLQADERFADTVVRWLSAPRVVEDIYVEARLNPKTQGIGDLKKAFKAGRLSSQMIEVTYSGTNEKILRDLSLATTTVLGRYTEELNRENKEKNWFVVIGSDPVIRSSKVGQELAILVGLIVGIFIGFWGVLVRHYLSEN